MPVPEDTAGRGTSWRPFGRSLYTPDMDFIARLQLDSSGTVTLRVKDDSVSMRRAEFNMLIRDYVRADSSRHSVNIGVTDGQAVVEMRAWLAATLLGALLLAAGLLVQLRRLQRQQREERREVERVVEQRRAAEAGREAERQRLAQDLHDGALQMLYAIRFHLPDTSVDVGPALQTVDGLLAQTAEQVRGVTAQLRAPMDATVRLPDALRTLLGRYPDLGGSVELGPEALDGLAPETSLVFYRIAQEAVSNAVRHGRASRVDVALARADGGHALTVSDDGAGFDPAEAATRTDRPHFGLVGMRERVEALGGTLALTTAPGRGTRLTATLPA